MREESRRVTGSGSFYNLLARLTAQYERDVQEASQAFGVKDDHMAKIQSLTKENLSLTSEIKDLRARLALTERPESPGSFARIRRTSMSAPSPCNISIPDDFSIPEESVCKELAPLAAAPSPHPLPGVPASMEPERSITSTAPSLPSPMKSPSVGGKRRKSSVRMVGSGTLQVRGMWIRNLESLVAGNKEGEQGKMPQAYIVASVNPKEFKRTPLRDGPAPSWSSSPPLMLAVGATDGDQVEFEVYGTSAESSESKRLGCTALNFRLLAAGHWSKMTQRLDCGGELELEALWDPAAIIEMEDKLNSRPSTAQSQAMSVHKVFRESSIAPTATAGHPSSYVAEQQARFARMFGISPERAPEALVTSWEIIKVLERKGDFTFNAMNLPPIIANLVQVAPLVRERGGSPTKRQSRRMSFTRKGSGGMTESGLHALLSKTTKDKTVTPYNTPTSTAIEFPTFVELMLIEHLSVYVKPEVAQEVRRMQRLLMTEDLDDVLYKLGISRQRSKTVLRPVQAHEKRRKTILWGLNFVVSLAVIISILALGLSLDNAPEHWAWVVLETLCTFVFVVEFCLKVGLSGLREYFFGPERYWNVGDVIITALALSDLVLSFADISSVGKLGLALRSLRLLRMARVMKMLRSPLVNDLANMLSGFVIGAPALFWVLVLLGVVVYVLALGFRMVAGPVGNASPIDECGFAGDDAPDNATDTCRPHLLYGEEFFGHMSTSMFTIFRCMTWDCATKGGQSLTVHFSDGYGMRFQIMYCVVSVIIIFGLFNVITAIFVETTMTGLKYNETKKMYNHRFENSYMKVKIQSLVSRITEFFEDSCDPSEGMIITKDQFEELLQDEKFSRILTELDISLSSQRNPFEIFDAEGEGHVKLPQMVSTLIKLRGEVQKSDLIAAWVAMKGINSKMRNVEDMLLRIENQP